MKRLLEVEKLMEADPTSKTNSAVFFQKLGVQKYEQLLRDGQTVEDWYRRNCGPDTAGSAWCEAVAKAKFDRDLAVATLSLSPNPTNMLGAADQASLALYQTIVVAAPPEVAPQVQLLIDQYAHNNGKQPQDAAAVSARESAQDAIVSSVHDQCGITMTRSNF